MNSAGQKSQTWFDYGKKTPRATTKNGERRWNPDVEVTKHGWEELRTFGATNNKYVIEPVTESNIRQLSVVNVLGYVSHEQ